jgi:hypothetical protein
MNRRKEVRKRFEQALKERASLQKQIDDITAKRELTQAEMTSRNSLGNELARKDFELSGLRDGYGLYLLESLEGESRTLKWLNIILLGLTAILAVFTGYLIGIRF